MSSLPKTILVYPVLLPMGPRVPIGLGYIARSLELAGYPYEFVDLNLDSEEDLFRRIQAFNPDFLGISIWNSCEKYVHGLLGKIRSHFPGVKVIAGGPQMVLNRTATMEACEMIDIGVSGEGHETIVEILRGDDPATIKGVFYRIDGLVRFTGERPPQPPDSVPYPTYSGFDLHRYGPKMSLISSYGCPYRCIYCSVPNNKGKTWRPKSSESLLEEVRFWHNRGYRAFQLQDSNLLMDRHRIRRFCEQVVTDCADCTFDARGIRADHLDKELLDLMKRAGFKTLRIGVESGSDKILQTLKKGETRLQIETGIAAAVEAGFDVVLYFLIGSPGEGPDDIKASFELARKYPIRKVNFFALTPEPGTEFHEWAVAGGYWTGMQHSESHWNSAQLRTDVLSVKELNRFHHMARLIEQEVAQRHEKRSASAQGGARSLASD